MVEFMAFAGMIMLLMAVFLIVFMFCEHKNANRKKENLSKVEYEQLNIEAFKSSFFIICEYCGEKFSTDSPLCPKCGGNYDRNREYLNKKKENNQKYLAYLLKLKENIQKETENIRKAKNYLKENIVMKNSFYNFDLNKPLAKYVPKDAFTFACEYCGTKLRGRSFDEKTCPHCGAGYADNAELLVYEEEDRVELAEYNKALAIREVMRLQNEDNFRKDDFMNKHAKGIALLILAGMFLIALTIYSLLF